jgi:hypothetical protein
MSSTTPITTPAQSPCKAAVATPARVTDPPCIDAATPTAAATKSEPRAPTPVVRAATDDEPQQQPLPPCAGSVATDEPHGEDSPAPALKKLRTEATLHEAASQPTPLTAVPAPAAEVTSAMDEPTAMTAATVIDRVIELWAAPLGADNSQAKAALAAALALHDRVMEINTAALGAEHLETAATLHQAVTRPTPLTAVPAPAAEVASTTDEPTATATAMTAATDGAPATPDHAAASARRSTTPRTATTTSAGRSTPAVLLGTPARRSPLPKSLTPAASPIAVSAA